MDFINFPHLTSEEFVEACHYLDRRYCRAHLGPLRKRWQVKLKTMLDSQKGFYDRDLPDTYIEITRLLDEADNPDFDLDFSSLSVKPSVRDPETNHDMMELEEADEAALIKPVQREFGFANYYIFLHPTYRMPCLWFSIEDKSKSILDIDTIFRRLVPQEYSHGLRSYGGVGGIGIDQSPLGPPKFFVHPCLAGDQMRGFLCSREDYLIKWLGLVGGCVGLWIPKEMVLIAGE